MNFRGGQKGGQCFVLASVCKELLTQRNFFWVILSLLNAKLDTPPHLYLTQNFIYALPMIRLPQILGLVLYGVQGWSSGESARLPSMWPGFDSQTRRQMWVECVGSLLCNERFSPGTPVSLSSKTNI